MLAFLTLAVVLAAAKAEPEINGGHCCPEREKQTILSTFHFSSCLLFFFFPQETFLFPAVVKGDEGQHVSCVENFISSFINSQHFTVGGG